MSMNRLCLMFVMLLAFGQSHAAFHEMKVVEVFPGTPAAPNAQYVVLQMWSNGQNQVGGHSVRVFDVAGTQTSLFTFGTAVPSGLSQRKILIATPEAATFFNITADLAMTSVILRPGGKICFDTFDCFAWGTYTGPAGSGGTAVGTPFNQPGQGGTIGGGGLLQGRAVIRSLGGDGILQDADDTANSAADFAFGVPAPRNNANVVGAPPPMNCGNGQLDGLEICDDGNQGDGDLCAADCLAVTSGLFVDGFE